MYVQADLRLCRLHIPHCWKYHVAAHITLSDYVSGSGRKALVEANGIRILYESAQDVIDCREMEGLILLASVIMRKCCPRNKLPLSDIRSVVTFNKPFSELYPEEGNGEFTICMLGNFCRLPVFSKLLFSKEIFQEYHHNVKQFGS